MVWKIQMIDGQWCAENGTGVIIWSDSREKLKLWLEGKWQR